MTYPPITHNSSRPLRSLREIFPIPDNLFPITDSQLPNPITDFRCHISEFLIQTIKRALKMDDQTSPVDFKMRA